jgi:hypothetical protein
VKWNAGRIMLACAGYFNWFQNTMMPEWQVDGGRADLVFISRAGYLTEIEIKVSMADWNHDAGKDKWKKNWRPNVSRFFYAVPETLENKIPDWLPPDAGVIVVRAGKTRDMVQVVREAKRKRCLPIETKEIQYIHRQCYYRFWRLEIQRRRAIRAKVLA